VDLTAEQVLNGLKLTPRSWLVFGLCCAGLFFESLNLQLMSFVAPMLAKDWDLGSGEIGLVISSAIFGMMAGTYLFGMLADRFGRRVVFQATVALFSIVTALSSFASGLLLLVAGRFIAGLGLGGSIPVETAVLSEFTPARHRTRLMALWAISLPVGGLVAPLCVAVLPAEFGWRGLLLLGGIPAVLVLFARRNIPETPLYLAGIGNLANALAALRWVGGTQLDGVAGLADNTDRAAVRDGTIQSPVSALFAKGMRRITAITWILNFGSFFAYYGLILWLPALMGSVLGFNSSVVLQIVFATALAGMTGRLFALVLAERIRREALIISFSLLGTASLVNLGFMGSTWSIGCATAASAFFLEGVFSAAIPWVAELYPAPIRATGVGWAGGFGRIGTALAPLVVGLLVKTSAFLALTSLAFGSLIAAAAISIWWWQERQSE
jgi:putative MFS transporter